MYILRIAVSGGSREELCRNAELALAEVAKSPHGIQGDNEAGELEGGARYDWDIWESPDGEFTIRGDDDETR